MRCPSWCPLCYSAVKGRRSYPGHFGHRSYRAPDWRYEYMALRRPTGAVSPGGSPEIFLAKGLLGQYVNVSDFLCVPQWDDGAPRQVGSLTLFCDEGRLKACVNDKDRGLVLFVSGSTLEELLDALDGHLVRGDGDWRASKQAAGKQRR